MTKKKALIVSSYPAPYRVAVFEGLANEYDVDVYFDTCQNESRHSDWFCKSSTCHFEILDNNNSRQKFSKALKNIALYDFVIAYDPARKPAMKAIVRCIATGVPYFANNDGAFIKPNLLKDLVKRILFSRVAACFSSGKSATEYFHHYGVPYSKIVEHKFTSIQRNDIAKCPLTMQERSDKRKKLNLPERKTVISVGQFIPRKGFDVLLHAWRKITDDIQLVIIGGGEERKTYEGLIADFHLKNVQLIDFMPKEILFEYYRASDLFVLPTREDVWGLVINEAMAVGIPVISTNRCNAALELIENGINGYIVEVGDEISLAERISEILTDDTKNMAMSAANIEKARQFTLEEIVCSHIATINRTLLKT